MMELFDQEKAVEQYGEEKKAEGRAEGRAEGKAEGRQEGEMKQARKTALNMREKGYPDAVIADILEVGESMIQKWFQGADAI